jgi:putative ABC transport system ATP-binding protein
MTLTFNSGQETNIYAVNKTNITIPEFEITIIYGASGSGKSSLLNILSGLQPPTTGELQYRGKNLYQYTKNELAYFRAKELGIVYQSNYWVKSLNVVDNVSLPLFFMGYSKQKANERALEALKRINMESYSKKYPILLSGGEQQRIAMARAIIADPPVIVADEPTGNLDSKNGDMIIDLLKQLHKENNKTIILVTHNMEYLSIASNLLEIHDGNVNQIGKNDIGKTVKSMLKETQDRISSMLEKDGNE